MGVSLRSDDNSGRCCNEVLVLVLGHTGVSECCELLQLHAAGEETEVQVAYLKATPPSQRAVCIFLAAAMWSERREPPIRGFFLDWIVL